MTKTSTNVIISNLTHLVHCASFMVLFCFQPLLDGRFPCHYCSLTFATQMSQRRHENLLHFKKYPYYCPECGKGVTGTAELNAHLASTHGQDQLKVSCPHCDLKFTRKNNMMAHCRLVHKETKPCVTQPGTMGE